MIASQSCCRFVGCTFMMPISYAAAFSPTYDSQCQRLSNLAAWSHLIYFPHMKEAWFSSDIVWIHAFFFLLTRSCYNSDPFHIPQKVGSLEPCSLLPKTYGCNNTLAQNITFIYINHHNKSPIKWTWKSAYNKILDIARHDGRCWPRKSKIDPEIRQYRPQYQYWYRPEKSSISGADVWKNKLTSEL